MSTAGPGTPGGPGEASWDPGQYLRFGNERARPFADLLTRVPSADPRLVVDLGCGTGALTAALARRWPAARVLGVDTSASMLARAAELAEPGRLEFVEGDVRSWELPATVDLLVSNAVLHWVPGHDLLLARWAAAVAPRGVLAVQVPGNFGAPTHTLLAQLCGEPRWADRLAGVAPRRDAVLSPDGYLDVLTGSGLAADVWETTYLHVLRGTDPVLEWVRGTTLRPVLDRLGKDDAAEFTARYAAALREAYPPRSDGTTVLPFRRIFLVGVQAG